MSARSVFSSDLENQLEALGQASLGEVRDFWRGRWGPPPRIRSVQILRALAAWRLQTPLYGSLDPLTNRFLKGQSRFQPPPPSPGTKLTREYKGVPHTVEVLDKGFRYGDGCYRSLSEIARLITGTHWNGPRFFGLRERVG